MQLPIKDRGNTSCVDAANISSQQVDLSPFNLSDQSSSTAGDDDEDSNDEVKRETVDLPKDAEEAVLGVLFGALFDESAKVRRAGQTALRHVKAKTSELFAAGRPLAKAVAIHGPHHKWMMENVRDANRDALKASLMITSSCPAYTLEQR